MTDQQLADLEAAGYAVDTAIEATADGPAVLRITRDDIVTYVQGDDEDTLAQLAHPAPAAEEESRPQQRARRKQE